ncbi:MAG: hypothetical protein FWG65_00905 [Turicibacter sp.]|nr:hypothetical protein [Turicibacter sp.]
MILTILMTILAVYMGFLTWACLFKRGGCDWVLIGSEAIADKQTKALFREKHDVPRMNRHFGKQVYLPLTLCFSGFVLLHTIGFAAPLSETIALAVQIAVFVALVAAFVNTMRVYLQFVGGKFERGKEESA